jgi:hypothetical protein
MTTPKLGHVGHKYKNKEINIKIILETRTFTTY